MRIGRTILAFLIALSLATLPMAGAFAVPQDEATASEVAVTSAHDCCEGDGTPAGHAMKECQAAAGCATKCFNFFAVALAGVTISLPTGGMDSPLVSDPIHSQTASLPFRPPRA
jgi:hypothetical protein